MLFAVFGNGSIPHNQLILAETRSPLPLVAGRGIACISQRGDGVEANSDHSKELGLSTRGGGGGI